MVFHTLFKLPAPVLPKHRINWCVTKELVKLVATTNPLQTPLNTKAREQWIQGAHWHTPWNNQWKWKIDLSGWPCSSTNRWFFKSMIIPGRNDCIKYIYIYMYYNVFYFLGSYPIISNSGWWRLVKALLYKSTVIICNSYLMTVTGNDTFLCAVPEYSRRHGSKLGFCLTDSPCIRPALGGSGATFWSR